MDIALRVVPSARLATHAVLQVFALHAAISPTAQVRGKAAIRYRCGGPTHLCCACIRLEPPLRLFHSEYIGTVFSGLCQLVALHR